MKAGLLVVVALALIVALGVVSEMGEKHPRHARRYVALWVFAACGLMASALWNVHRSGVIDVGALSPSPTAPSLAPSATPPSSPPRLTSVPQTRHPRSRVSGIGGRVNWTAPVPAGPPPPPSAGGPPPWESPPPPLPGSPPPTHTPSPKPTATGPSPTPTTPSPTPTSPSPTPTSPSPTPTSPSPDPS